MKMTKVISQFCLMLVIILLSAACSQTGDFGRVHQSPASIFDPRPGQNRQGEFAIIQTDEEKQMLASIKRFDPTIDGNSWIAQIRKSANVLAGAYPDESDYYVWLRRQPFASSAGRYGKILSEVELDSMTVPAAFASICAVQDTDRRRAIAAEALTQGAPGTMAMIVQRRQDNNQQIAGFVAVLEFRYDSYSYALEQLLVETPHENARAVDAKLNILAVQVQMAQANQFC